MNKKVAFVYIWTNKINQRKYLGSHWGYENDGYMGSGLAFKYAIRLYGKEAFERQIIEYTTKSLRLIREQFWLDHFNVSNNSEFYNISGSASGGRTMEGKSPKEIAAWRTKCSQSQKMRTYKPTPEARYKMSVASKLYWTDKRREQKRLASIGENNNMFGKKRKHTTETREKMKIAQRKRYTNLEERKRSSRPGASNPKAKAVTIDGIKYLTMKEAVMATGLTKYKVRKIYAAQNTNSR